MIFPAVRLCRSRPIFSVRVILVSFLTASLHFFMCVFKLQFLDLLRFEEFSCWSCLIWLIHVASRMPAFVMETDRRICQISACLSICSLHVYVTPASRGYGTGWVMHREGLGPSVA